MDKANWGKDSESSTLLKEGMELPVIREWEEQDTIVEVPFRLMGKRAKKFSICLSMLLIIEVAPIASAIFMGLNIISIFVAVVLCKLLYCGVMVSLKREDKEFVIAGICSLLSPIVGAITLMLALLINYSVYLRDVIMFVPFIILSNVWKYYECKRLAELAYEIKMNSYGLWEKLWLGNLIANLVLILGFMDDFVQTGVVFMIIGFLGLLVFAIIKCVLLITALMKLRKMSKEGYLE